ncbi:hypothetical protein KJ980_03210 [Patescibacteria group bacterium]|nr:hypothetical protein [Patescibacteria group bacterium]MBU4017260.1 hypothetical protein [Patescibacteria group bacterium]MBU4098635.1 hypothetical protein [Patescibacteria group bacterium]
MSSEKKGAPLISYLLELLKRGFNFAYSEITLYELLRGATVQKEEAMLKILNSHFKYFLKGDVIIAAARLDNIMKLEKIEINSVDHGDKFIASTAILTGSLILTANARDFPWPLFQHVENKHILYTDKNKATTCFMVSLMRPDYKLINLRFKERPK